MAITPTDEKEVLRLSFWSSKLVDGAFDHEDEVLARMSQNLTRDEQAALELLWRVLDEEFR